MPTGGLITVYDKTEDYTATLQEAGDHIFLHLDVENWSPSVLREIKSKWPVLLEHIVDKGYSILFTYSKDKQSVKFWNMMQPLTETRKFGPENEYLLGAWDLEE